MMVVVVVQAEGRRKRVGPHLARQSLARERRRVDAQHVPLHPLNVGRHRVAAHEQHHVPGHELACVDLDARPVAHRGNLGLHLLRQLLLRVGRGGGLNGGEEREVLEI